MCYCFGDYEEKLFALLGDGGIKDVCISSWQMIMRKKKKGIGCVRREKKEERERHG